MATQGFRMYDALDCQGEVTNSGEEEFGYSMLGTAATIEGLTALVIEDIRFTGQPKYIVVQDDSFFEAFEIEDGLTTVFDFPYIKQPVNMVTQ